jgi:hypothetical protein
VPSSPLQVFGSRPLADTRRLKLFEDDGVGDFEWMRTALNTLFDEWTDDRVRALLTDETARTALLAEIDSVPPLDPGYLDNLLMGVVALRLKFPREEATAKLDLNLTMRGQRR